LHRRAGVTGDYLANADVGFSEMGTPEVLFTMNRKGGDLMGRLTGENVGRRMAIVLDEKITSAPVIQSQINDRGRITLGAGLDPVKVQEEAKDLVAVLRSGSLPAPLTKTFETQVGRTLGDDTVDRAMLSMYVGAVAVVLFMLLYYRLSGLISIVAMVLNLLFMVAILAALEAALTLPGIAGLVLTVGMAVDANIIIYERIREELRLGRSPRTAVDAGFDRAFWTVFDGHVTTFVAGVVLYSYGSGPIRGFAVTLLVGIISNLITSVWISRWLFDLMVGRRGSSPATLSI
jgi:preprotein translocase subunit SecD